MSLRAPKDTAESLRHMLQGLEQMADPAEDADARAELRRILLLRIANLEAVEVLKADTLRSTAKEPPGPTADPKSGPQPVLPLHELPQPSLPVEVSQPAPADSAPVISPKSDAA